MEHKGALLRSSGIGMSCHGMSTTIYIFGTTRYLYNRVTQLGSIACLMGIDPYYIHYSIVFEFELDNEILIQAKRIHRKFDFLSHLLKTNSTSNLEVSFQ